MPFFLGCLRVDADVLKPGHEYTKGNVKFGTQVIQSDAIKKLEKFATENKQTQGKFTIGDEKVCCINANSSHD